MVRTTPSQLRGDAIRRTGKLIAAVGFMVAASCSAVRAEADGPPDGNFDEAAARAVVIGGTGCGDAVDTVGSGVRLSGGRVLTAAHVVIGASSISVSAPDDDGVPASVIALDPLRDLALLEAGPSVEDAADDPTFVVLGDDDRGLIIGGRASGDIEFTVTGKVRIEVNEVRGDRRSLRSGYRLDAETRSGDSGAGLYDTTGNFAGLLFAVSTEDGGRSWATAADEIEAFLADQTVRGDFECNPVRSKVEAGP